MKALNLFITLFGAVLAVFLLLVFVGCGGDDNPMVENTQNQDGVSGTEIPAKANPEELIKLGKVAQANGFTDEAIKFFEQAIRTNPQAYEAYTELAFIQLTQNKFDQAEKNLVKAYKIKLDDPKIHEGLARVYLAQDRGIQAEFHYKLALSLYKETNPGKVIALEQELGRVVKIKKAIEEIYTTPDDYGANNLPPDIIIAQAIVALPSQDDEKLDRDLMAEIYLALANGHARLFYDKTSRYFLGKASSVMAQKDLIQAIKESRFIDLDYNPIREMALLPKIKELRISRINAPEGIKIGKEMQRININFTHEVIGDKAELEILPKPPVKNELAMYESQNMATAEFRGFPLNLTEAEKKQKYIFSIKNIISKETGEMIEVSFPFYLE